VQIAKMPDFILLITGFIDCVCGCADWWVPVVYFGRDEDGIVWEAQSPWPRTTRASNDCG